MTDAQFKAVIHSLIHDAGLTRDTTGKANSCLIDVPGIGMGAGRINFETGEAVLAQQVNPDEGLALLGINGFVLEGVAAIRGYAKLLNDIADQAEGVKVFKDGDEFSGSSEELLQDTTGVVATTDPTVEAQPEA